MLTDDAFATFVVAPEPFEGNRAITEQTAPTAPA